jgi:hypothetical protein
MTARPPALLVMVRQRGTVTVVSTEAGWDITGSSGLRMRIPRCTCNQHVCPTIHLAGAYGSCPGTPTLTASGNAPGHGRNHCHRGHRDRILRLVELVARTYGPAVRS